MDSLPVEILEHIFSYFSKSYLAIIACVCKRWHQSTLCFIFHNVKVKWKLVRSSESFNVTKSLHIYREYDENYMNFIYQVPIPWCDLKPDYVKIIQYCDPEKLTTLCLHDCGITDKDLKLAFHKFEKLETLCLSYCPSIGRSSWLSLQKLTTLKKLALRGMSMNDNHFRDVLKNLNLLELEMGTPHELTEKSIQWVTKETQLKVLLYQRLAICLKSLNNIDRLVNLEKLDLEGTFMNDDIFKKICHCLSKLTSINVSHCQLTGQGMCFMENLNFLNELNLYWNHVTDEGCSYISNCISLTRLNLSYNGLITDNGVRYLALLKNLTHLNISINMLISNTGLLYISQLSLLTNLNLANCFKITDNGIEHLTLLLFLTDLDLGGCRSLTHDCLQHICKINSLEVFHPFCPINELDTSLLYQKSLIINDLSYDWSRWTRCPSRKTNFGKLKNNLGVNIFDKLQMNL